MTTRFHSGYCHPLKRHTARADTRVRRRGPPTRHEQRGDSVRSPNPLVLATASSGVDGARSSSRHHARPCDSCCRGSLRTRTGAGGEYNPTIRTVVRPPCSSTTAHSQLRPAGNTRRDTSARPPPARQGRQGGQQHFSALAAAQRSAATCMAAAAAALRYAPPAHACLGSPRLCAAGPGSCRRHGRYWGAWPSQTAYQTRQSLRPPPPLPPGLRNL